MLVAIIFLAVVMLVVIAAFSIKMANMSHSVECIFEKYVLLHEKFVNHEDRISTNYKSLAKLNQRQDEWMQRNKESEQEIKDVISQVGLDVLSLQEKMGIPTEFDEIGTEIEKSGTEIEDSDNAQSPTSPLSPKSMSKRERFCELRKTMSFKEVVKEMNLPRTTARRYEQWRKTNTH